MHLQLHPVFLFSLVICHRAISSLQRDAAVSTQVCSRYGLLCHTVLSLRSKLFPSLFVIQRLLSFLIAVFHISEDAVRFVHMSILGILPAGWFWTVSRVELICGRT